jgi:hypothetical protein
VREGQHGRHSVACIQFLSPEFDGDESRRITERFDEQSPLGLSQMVMDDGASHEARRQMFIRRVVHGLAATQDVRRLAGRAV